MITHLAPKIALRLLLLPVAVAALLAGCNTNGCLDNQSSVPLAGFYSGSDGSKITLDSLSIGGVDAPNDSLLLNIGTPSQSVYLPLRSNRNEAAFFVRYGYEALNYSFLNDTISIAYSSIPYFASEECGAMYRYSIRSVAYTTHLIDSIAVVDSLVTNIESERLKIYFRQ